MNVWKTDKVKKKLMEAIDRENVSVERFRGKTILITGGCGLIGRMLVRAFAAVNEQKNLEIRLILLVRDGERAKEMFASDMENTVIEFLVQDISEEIRYDGAIDFVIHGASITASREMIEHPLKVIEVNVEGTRRILDLAAEKKTESVLYLSSMEAYGFTTEEKLLNETCMEYINPMLVRSCYPESKRMAENMCVCYVSEKNVPVKMIRLGQTFGYGVEADDTRVFAEFARCAVKSEDIALLTPGDSTRMYLDTIDAVTAILTVLLKGNPAEVYNAANKDTYCSIVEMAHFVAEKVTDGEITVTAGSKDTPTKQFSPLIA